MPRAFGGIRIRNSKHAAKPARKEHVELAPVRRIHFEEALGMLHDQGRVNAPVSGVRKRLSGDRATCSAGFLPASENARDPE